MKPILLLDIDGVVANLRPVWLQAINDALETSFKDEDLITYEMFDNFNINKDQQKIARAKIATKHLARDVEPFPEAIKAIKELEKFSDIYFNTSYTKECPTWVYDRTNWIDKHLGKKFNKKLIFTSNKFLVKGNIFVDDMPYHIDSWAHYNPEEIAVLWAYRYNETYFIRNNVLRFNDWDLLVDMVHARSLI